MLHGRLTGGFAMTLAVLLISGGLHGPGAAILAATATDPWVFVSSPDWFNTDIADLSGATPGVPAAPGWADGASGGINGVSPQMLEVYGQLAGEMATYGPQAVLVAGDLVNGLWFTVETLDMFAPGTRDRDEAIDTAGSIYYLWLRKLFDDYGIRPIVAALGDHEIGDDAWVPGSEKALKITVMKRAFVRHTVLPLELPEPFPGIPARPPESQGFYASTAIRLNNVLLVSVDQFDGLQPGESADPQNGVVVLRVRGDHLDWLADLLAAADVDDTLDHVIVQGHVPVLDPVRMQTTSGLMFRERDGSAFWQLLRQHDRSRGGKVCCYLAGEVHAPTVVRDLHGDIVQIVHGNPPRFLGDQPAGSYAVFVVRPTRIDVELRRFDLFSDGTSLFWQPGIFSGDLVTEGPSATSGGRTEGRLTVYAGEPGTPPNGTGWLQPVPYAGMPVHFSFDAQADGGEFSNTGDFGDLYYVGRRVGGARTGSGMFGDGLLLDGVDDHVRSGRGNLVEGETRTVGAWVQLTAGRGRAILSYGGRKAGLNGRFVFRLNGGVPELLISPELACRPTGASPVNDGQWHHVAVVLRRPHDNVCSDLQFLVDGVSLGAPVGTARLHTVAWSDYRIGTDERAAGSFFAGSIDDVAIWHAALTPGQIRAMVGAGRHSGLRYDARRMQALFLLYAGRAGSVVVDGLEWRYVTGLAGSAGDVAGAGGEFTIQFDGAGNGVASGEAPPPPPPPDPDHVLRCSADDVVDGLDPLCAGGVFPDRIWVYLWPEEGVERVDFRVDGVIANSDTSPPYELDGRDATVFSPGEHEASAVVALVTGDEVSVAASFLVTGPSPNQPPVIDPPGSWTVAALTPLSVPVTARDADGPAPLVLTATGVPAGAVFTDFGDGHGDFSWTPQAGDVSATPYVVTLTATDGGGLSASAVLRVTVVAGAQGAVSGTVTAPTGTANLTAEGSVDWVHVGLSEATSVNRKAGVLPQVGPVRGLGRTPSRFSSRSRLRYVWMDGTPTESATTHAGLWVGGYGNGFEVTLPADVNLRTATVYLGGYRAEGRLEASLSDGSAVPYVVRMSDLETAFDRRVALAYRAATPGSTLTLRYTLTAVAGGGNVTFQAVTLQGD